MKPDFDTPDYDLEKARLQLRHQLVSRVVNQLCECDIFIFMLLAALIVSTTIVCCTWIQGNSANRHAQIMIEAGYEYRYVPGSDEQQWVKPENEGEYREQ